MKDFRVFLATICVIALAVVVNFAQNSKADKAGATSTPTTCAIVKDSWDWVSEMAKVTKNFTGTEGVVLHMGDSITCMSQATAWGKAGCPGGTADDQAIAKWSHCGEKGDKNGWHLASVEIVRGRSETAEHGITTEQYIKGTGSHGLPPMADIIKKFNPQVAFIMLGTNDVTGGKKIEDVTKNMSDIIDALIKNGTIPVIITIPVRTDGGPRLERTQKYNAAYVKLAQDKKIPLIDMCGEMLSRQPMDKMKGTLVCDDTVHLTKTNAEGPPTAENLATGGGLLRCYLVVKKLEEVKSKVLNKK